MKNEATTTVKMEPRRVAEVAGGDGEEDSDVVEIKMTTCQFCPLMLEDTEYMTHMVTHFKNRYEINNSPADPNKFVRSQILIRQNILNSDPHHCYIGTGTY